MRLHLSIILVFFSCFLFSQKVSVIKVTDLEKRLQNKSDTTYIVNFWATWCAPCVKELPDFDSISKTHAGDKVKVLLVTMDFKEDMDSKLKPFLLKKQLVSEVLLMDESNGNYFIPRISDKWTGALPATLIINNKNGVRDFYEKKLNYQFLTDELKKQTLK